MRPVDTPARSYADSADRELEADVMRFVAILALCLVAISTLVDDLPPAPPPAAVITPRPDPAEPAQPAKIEGPTSIPAARVLRTMVPASPASPPASASARAGDAVPITSAERAAGRPSEPRSPAPVAAPSPEPPPTVSGTPTAPRVRPTSARTGAPAPSVASAADGPPSPGATDTRPRRGFTLRFATDAALLRLVARGTAEVFVFDGAETLRLALAAAGPIFSPAPGPSQFHAIDGATVPAVLQEALAARAPLSDEAVWGVTLPADTRRALAGLIRSHDGGALVIDERGRVRLEAVDD
jgi:hypothetical protein